jgi:hypothetical protein
VRKIYDEYQLLDERIGLVLNSKQTFVLSSKQNIDLTKIDYNSCFVMYGEYEELI